MFQTARVSFRPLKSGCAPMALKVAEREAGEVSVEKG